MAFEIVVVGTSTGGLNALQTVLHGISESFPLPIVMVQHRGRNSDTGLCAYLNRHSNLSVTEPEDKESIVRGRAYLAPRDYHLLVEGGGFALSTDAPVTYARPSIDVLFESAADEYRANVIGLILSGGNDDGAKGLARIKEMGGLTLVQDPQSAACREMPQAALKLSEPDRILTLEEIVPYLQSIVAERVAHGA